MVGQASSSTYEAFGCRTKGRFPEGLQRLTISFSRHDWPLPLLAASFSAGEPTKNRPSFRVCYVLPESFVLLKQLNLWSAFELVGRDRDTKQRKQNAFLGAPSCTIFSVRALCSLYLDCARRGLWERATVMMRVIRAIGGVAMSGAGLSTGREKSYG